MGDCPAANGFAAWTDMPALISHLPDTRRQLLLLPRTNVDWIPPVSASLALRHSAEYKENEERPANAPILDHTPLV